MYLPRSAALLGSRATCKEKRDLGQETVPGPLQAEGPGSGDGAGLTAGGGTWVRRRRRAHCRRPHSSRWRGRGFTACPGFFPLIRTHQSQKGWRDPPSKPRGLPVNTTCLRSLSCLVGNPGSAAVCLNTIRLMNAIINTADLPQAFS